MQDNSDQQVWLERQKIYHRQRTGEILARCLLYNCLIASNSLTNHPVYKGYRNSPPMAYLPERAVSLKQSGAFEIGGKPRYITSDVELMAQEIIGAWMHVEDLNIPPSQIFTGFIVIPDRITNYFYGLHLKGYISITQHKIFEAIGKRQ